MGKSLIERCKSRYTKRLNKISKELRLGKTYRSLSKSQQKKVEKEYNNKLSKELIPWENFNYDLKLQKLTKKIPMRAQKYKLKEK